tara:strand:- start:405 stop:587 length:183 start_codon:yes stop_codon:yes gene_type:complete
MGEAKRRRILGLPPRDVKKSKNTYSKSKLNSFLNQYPYLPYIFGIALLVILILDLVNYYS